MIYSSLPFIYVFLPVSIFLFFVVPKKYSEYLMLALSAVFCGFLSLYLLFFMIVYIFLNFSMCRIIEYLKKNKTIAEVPLASMIVLDITALFSFRAPYMKWFADMIHAPEGVFPIGISFFTLSMIGTLIDVYKGKIKAERNIVRFALYIMFFPRLIMGPLLRYGSFVKIMDSSKRSPETLGEGLILFIKGLAKKVIAADSLYMLYSAAARIESGKLTSLTAFMGLMAYLLCLYFNLSGFADMGNGVSLCFGYKFPQSFSYPLFSRRVRIFMSRWLSQVNMWFRRYAVKPLMTVSRKKWVKSLIFIFVWSLIGFWYTFSLNGFAAGMFIGIVIIIESRLLNQNIMEITGIIWTFAVALIWTAFISGNGLGDSLKYIAAVFGRNGLADSQSIYFIKSYSLVICGALFASTDIVKRLVKKAEGKKIGNVFSVFIPFLAVGVLLVCTALMSSDGGSEMLLIRF